jgi:hypothetical protein
VFSSLRVLTFGYRGVENNGISVDLLDLGGGEHWKCVTIVSVTACVGSVKRWRECLRIANK